MEGEEEAKPTTEETSKEAGLKTKTGG